MTSDVISTVFSGLYGCCLMQDDEHLVLQMLHHLMKLQLTTANNPRKLLRQGNCAFSRLYKIFHEELFSAKLFLTSSLYEPILSLLTEDEIFLDIDPSKAVIRFPPQERLKKFGKEDSPEYPARLKEHREFIINKLESITNRFINGIRNKSSLLSSKLVPAFTQNVFLAHVIWQDRTKRSQCCLCGCYF